jgi:mycothiol maleylpyruvate isomerase-like protein
MPPPLAELAAVARLDDEALVGNTRRSRRDVLYGLLRREQAIAASGESSARSEASRILDFAQAAYGDVVGVLVGRDDSLLDTARDGEWSLRDVLRHAVAVELRYAAQVEYSATRMDTDPVAIPPGLLPCDRLSPPDPEFGASRTRGVLELLQLLGQARAGSDTRLAKVPAPALARPSMWGTQLLDVRMRLHQIAVHLTETAIQIEKIVGGGGEVRAVIRRCCITRGMHERWSPPEERAVLDDSYHRLTA